MTEIAGQPAKRETHVVAAEQHLVAIGGGGLGGLAGDVLDDYVLDLTGSPKPRVLFVPTGWGDDASAVEQVTDLMRSRAEVSPLLLISGAVADLRSVVRAHDLVWVSGGDTHTMLAVWRARGLDVVLRDAWEAGVVLAGASAGALCWFEDGVTRVSETDLAPLGDGLGLLTGSFCAHYDVPDRRAAYPRLVADGLRPGLGVEDRVGVHFAGTELREVVSARPEATAYRVHLRNGAVAEEALPARVL